MVQLGVIGGRGFEKVEGLRDRGKRLRSPKGSSQLDSGQRGIIYMVIKWPLGPGFAFLATLSYLQITSVLRTCAYWPKNRQRDQVELLHLEGVSHSIAKFVTCSTSISRTVPARYQ